QLGEGRLIIDAATPTGNRGWASERGCGRRTREKEVSRLVLQQIAEVRDHDVRLVVDGVLRVERVLALEDVHRREAVAEYGLRAHEDARLVVDQDVMLGLEVRLYGGQDRKSTRLN